jgi:hypothetical protein
MTEMSVNIVKEKIRLEFKLYNNKLKKAGIKAPSK